MPHLALVVLMAVFVASCSGRASTPTSPTSTSSTPSTTTAAALPSCRTWAGQQRGSGVSAALDPAQRQAFYDAGGGIRAVGGKYYGAWFPTTYGSGSGQRLLVGLHGTGGSPETEWATDWGVELPARGWAYLGLKYVDVATGVHDDDTTIYAQIKAMVEQVRLACGFGSPSMFLVGFSRGSAESFPVAYLDLHDRRLFSAIGNNSGAWAPGQPMVPTLEAIVSRGDTAAFRGSRFWMYCGERDMQNGFPMCDGMQAARTFVAAQGATILGFFRDPTGAHGGLNRNATALAQMFAAFEGL